MLNLAIFTLVLAGILFLSSGRPGWVMAWVYLGLVTVNTSVMQLVIDPDLRKERSRRQKDAKRWDVPLVLLMGWILPAATLITAGLEIRFQGLRQVPSSLQFVALAVAVPGLLWADWAAKSNRFFSAVVRIQKDRDHTVVSAGPYRVMRHPGYAGGILLTLATPLILGSRWALIPAGLLVMVSLVRTTLEDRTLMRELDGYREYAREVHYRLLPGVW